SAIALIRLSGRGAFDLAAPVRHPLRPAPPRAVRRVRVMHPARGEPVDDALVACFPAPRSYTGDDLVELSTHGGLLVPAAAVAALLAAGARPAAPGEFSRRAVLNGKLDLLQAEATADLIDAGSPAQGRRALQQLDRGLSQRLEQLRAELIELEALIAYEIDFPEEDEGPVAPERIERAWGRRGRGSTRPTATPPGGERRAEGGRPVIAARRTAGKPTRSTRRPGRVSRAGGGRADQGGPVTRPPSLLPRPRGFGRDRGGSRRAASHARRGGVWPPARARRRGAGRHPGAPPRGAGAGARGGRGVSERAAGRCGRRGCRDPPARRAGRARRPDRRGNPRRRARSCVRELLRGQMRAAA